MGDRWIVSSHSYMQHRSLHAAAKERERLSKKFPDTAFRIYRTKTQLGPTRSRQIIESLQKEVDDLQAEIESLKSQIAALMPDS